MLIQITIICTFLFSSAAFGGEQKIIRAGAIFDSQSGQLIPSVDIKIDGAQIVGVEKNIEPGSAEVIDLREYTVVPGLIDVHTHLLLLQKLNETFEQGANRHVRAGLDFRLEQAKPLAESFVMAGITTVRELGNCGQFGDIKLRDTIARGDFIGPRVIPSGTGISPKGGQFAEGTVEDWVVHEEYQIIETVSEARAAVEKSLEQGAKVIKIFSDAAPGPGFLSVEQMKVIVEIAHANGIKVAAHAVSDKSVATAIEAGVDSIEHGYEVSDQSFQLMAQKKIVFVPTDISIRLASLWIKDDHPDWTDERILEAARGWQQQGSARFKRALSNGVSIAMGSDMYLDFSASGLSQGEAARDLLNAFVEEGMTPAAALQTATFNAAQLLGYENKLGVISGGAFADLIAVKGDPTKDLSALSSIVFIMQNGKVLKK